MPMLESPLAWLLTASKNVKVSFLQGFFESAAKIDAEKGRVAVEVPPLHAPVVLKLLLEVGAYPAEVGAYWESQVASSGAGVPLAPFETPYGT